MVEVIYYAAMSLDGFIATADGGVAWLEPYNQPAEDYGYADFFASVDALLMGSRTYEQVQGFRDWPYGGKPCLVFSSRKLEAPHPQVTVTPLAPRPLLTSLAGQGYGRLWLVGGADLATSFRNAGLITEYILTIMPLMLGEGVPFLQPGGSLEHLKLLESRPFSNGVVQVRYTSL